MEVVGTGFGHGADDHRPVRNVGSEVRGLDLNLSHLVVVDVDQTAAIVAGVGDVGAVQVQVDALDASVRRVIT